MSPNDERFALTMSAVADPYCACLLSMLMDGEAHTEASLGIQVELDACRLLAYLERLLHLGLICAGSSEQGSTYRIAGPVVAQALAMMLMLVSRVSPSLREKAGKEREEVLGVTPFGRESQLGMQGALPWQVRVIEPRLDAANSALPAAGSLQ